MKRILTFIFLISMASCALKQPLMMPKQRSYVVGKGFIGEWKPLKLNEGDTIIFITGFKIKDYVKE